MTIEQIKKKLYKEAPKFARGVAPFYKLLEWRWGQATANICSIPSEKDILCSIRAKIRDLETNKNNCVIDGGGLRVGYRINKDTIEYVMEFTADLGSVNKINEFSEFNGWEVKPIKKSKPAFNIITDTERNINV